MNPKLKVRSVFFALAICLAMASVVSAADPAAITTDKNRYSVGETMTISGTGFTPLQGVTVSVLRPDKLTDYVVGVTANDSGAFTAQYLPADPIVPGRYKITATDKVNTATTASTEADAIGFDLRQCAQNDKQGNTPLGLGFCNWIGSSLGAGNSLLYEGLATEQQLLVTGLSGSSHTMRVGIQATKGGNHAYDWLVSDADVFGGDKAPDSTRNSEKASLQTGITLQLNRCGDQMGTADKAACVALVGAGGFPVDIPVPDDPYISQDGSTQDRIDAYETLFGNRTVRLYSSAEITGTPTMTLVHMNGKSSGSVLANGADTGDSYIWFTITWNSTGTSAMLVGGADIALGGDGTGRSWGAGRGATGISGDPYHFYLIDVDGTGGSLDNQMSSSAIFSPPHLTLVKVVTNDNGGTRTITDFPLTATGPVTITGVSGTTAVTNAPVAIGTYTLSEQTQADYTASAWVCVGGTQSGSTITLAQSETATCTITNNDNAPALHLRKTVTNDNGGTALNTAWTLTATGALASPTNLSGSTPVDSGATFKADTYALGESGPANYTASAWVCVGGTQNGSNITVALGESATCTINNDDNPPALHLRKVVVNDNGGTAVATDWTLSAAGTTPLSGTTPVDSGATFSAGTYILSESGPANYTASAWVCVGGTQNGSNITVTVGQSSTCTITNNDNAPALHLRKVVVNDNGGTAVATDWTLSAAGTTPLSGTTPVDSGATFSAGTYALSESGPANYTASAWVCVGGTQNGSNITVALGQSATCTITNNDNPPGLHLRKIVVNDNGGTAAATDWTLSAGTGPTPISGTTPVDSGASFQAGTYALSESGPANYTASAWVCVGGTQNGSNITVAVGQSATCTITNNDNAPALHLRKVVVNDNGGTAVATDWTLSAAGTTPLSGTTPVDSGAGFSVGTYALSESGPANYTAGAWVCVGGTQNGANITLGLGQSATCTITNNDNPPALHLRKIVVNDNGGTSVATDWTLSAAGTTPLSGTTPVDSGAGFSAGTYALSESGPANYTASAWVCVGGTQNGSNITVTVGQSATCTITNNDNAPALHLRKVVVNNNGGTAVATDWTLSAAGTTPLSGTTPVDSGATFSAGTYALSESGPANYTASAWVCVGGTQNGSNITVALGQSATCTITNDDNAPALHLRKLVVNNNGGTAVDTDWTLSAAGTTPLSGTTPVDSGTTFSAGTYALSESGPANYTASAWVCVGGTQNGSNITVALGQSATCTITNNDNAPALHLRKIVVNGNSGAALATAWTLSAAGTTPLSGTTPVDSGATFSAGTYALGESGPAGYAASAWVCVGGTQNGSNITVALGQSATCTITNTALPTLRIVKNATGTGAPTFSYVVTGVNSLDAPTTNISPPVPGSAEFGPVVIQPGSSTIAENTPPSGWTLTDVSCSGYSGGGTGAGPLDSNGIPTNWNFIAAFGDAVVCTYVNNNAGTTRTQGFWATHTGLANAVWNGTAGAPVGSIAVIGSADDSLCGIQITADSTTEENWLMGGFWASISKLSDPTLKGKDAQRSNLDQARMQMLQQYLAAVLNYHTFGTIGESVLSAARTAYCTGTLQQVKAQIGILGGLNEAGDSGVFTPGASATPKDSKDQADIDAWDNPVIPGSSDED